MRERKLPSGLRLGNPETKDEGGNFRMKLIETATMATRQAWKQILAEPLYCQAHALVCMAKQAADVQPTLGLTGRLYLSHTNWLMLSVPNAVGRGAFAALDEEGVELPTDDETGLYNAHISVMRPEEVEQIGGADRISERGKMFAYQLGAIKTVRPDNWEGVSRVWFFDVHSPMLQRLRLSYGLPALPQKRGEDIPFHISVAIRRTRVLRDSDVAKGGGGIGKESG